MAGIVGIAIYYASTAFPGSKSVKKRENRQSGIKTAPKNATLGTKGQNISTTPNVQSSSYDESWIPEHHLKSRQGASSPKPRANRTTSGKK